MKTKDNLQSVPADLARFIAASMMFAYALFSALTTFAAGYAWMGILNTLVGLVLAVCLFWQSGAIRLVAIVWAIQGLVSVPILVLGYQFEAKTIFFLLAMQVCFSLATVLLLGWRTVRWRIATGTLLTVAFAMFTLVAAIEVMTKSSPLI